MLILVLVLLGLCFGSFVNAYVWRLHEQGTRDKGQGTRSTDLSIWKGHSMCPYCWHRLSAIDLIPIFSWLLLKGRCRYCKKPISVQYPLVEAITANLFVLSYLLWPYGWETAGIILFGSWLIALVVFMSLMIYDLRWMLLPNRIVSFLLGVAVLQVIIKVILEADKGVILSSLIGAVVIGGLFYVLFTISDGKWIGGGDVKLGAVLGLFVGGLFSAILVIFVASFLGSIVGIVLIYGQKSGLKKRIPFGPFLIIATILVYLFGSNIITWYQAHLLYANI